jgi:hypothetical protein
MRFLLQRVVLLSSKKQELGPAKAGPFCCRDHLRSQMEIPCFREFLREFFAPRTPISSIPAQNPQILRFAEGMEQGITGISYLTTFLTNNLQATFAGQRQREQGICREFCRLLWDRTFFHPRR